MRNRLLIRLLQRIARAVGVPELQTLIANANGSISSLETSMSGLEKLTRSRLREVDGLRTMILRDVDQSISSSIGELRTHVDQSISSSIGELRTHVYEHVEAFTNERINAAQTAVVQHMTAQFNSTLDELRNHIDIQLSQLRRDIDGIRSSRIFNTNLPPEARGSASSPMERVPEVDDSLYVSLEDKFRGSVEVIKQRQQQYLNEIMDTVTLDYPLVDLGCGRGEWIELVTASGLPAVGVDSNIVAVAECNRRGLDARHGDIFEYLRQLEDEEVGAISLFQVLEHLEFSGILEVMRQARRVLKPGGVLIAEVPNGQNLTVAASTFWIDPTHKRLIYPAVLQFVAEQVGFSQIKQIFSTPLKNPPDLDGLPDNLRSTIKDLYEPIYGSADFALIAVA